MDDRKLLIVGIDPGITTGYAVLGIDGNLISTTSSKQLDLNLIISETIKLGKVMLVGTDKAKIPNLVETFATKVGAKIISPNYDLRIDEKRKMTFGYKFYDEHQGDALASALFAYRSSKSLLDKIDFFADKNKKHAIKNRIKELVISKGISIKSAVGIIERKTEEAQIINKVIAEKKLAEGDFLKVYGKLKKYESEIVLMRKYNNDLLNRIKNLELKSTKRNAKRNYDLPKDFREKRISMLENSIKIKNVEIEKLNLMIKKFNDKISNMSSFYILKKLGTLGLKEFNFKNKILNIGRNDIILVDNPNILSNEVAHLLKDKVFVIIYKEPVSRKIETALPFVFISASNLKIEETEHFGFIEKRHFEMEKNKIDWVRKIVDDYKNQKEGLIFR